MKGKCAPNFVKFFETAGELKKVKRQGWLDRGVKSPESVADHCFRVALMSMALADEMKLDACRAMRLALVHDLPEALCGDIATRISEGLQSANNSEKHRREEAALKKILKSLGGEAARDIFSLWNEFEERKTAEARLVYELDRLEAVFQAAEYERAGNFSVSLQEFYDYADARISMPALREIFLLLMKHRRIGKNNCSCGGGKKPRRAQARGRTGHAREQAACR